MNDIIWKAFKLSDLFEFSSGNTFALKNYNLYNEPGDGLIEVVTSSKDSEKNQFISAGDIPSSCPIYEKSLTINRNGSIGYCLYHDDKFIIPTGDSYTLLHKNEKFKNAMNIYVNSFLSIIITHLFTTTVFGWSYKVNSDRFDRELILLPCLEVGKDDEYIWEEKGHYYTLAVNYIKQLMNEAKELREQKTIRLYEAERAKYEAERAKYEAERAKYEAGYKREKDLLVWKSFALGTLFGWSSRKDLALKNYNKIDHYEDGYVEVVTGSKDDKNDFISFDELPKNYPTYQDCLCLNTNGSIGYCLYYDRPIISPTSSVHILLHKYEKLKKLMTIQVNGFFSKVISNIFTNGIYNRTACLISDEKFAREIILLPCLEVGKDDEYIWEEKGHYYTLAVNYISYIYLTGKMKNSQKKIDNYTYQY